LRVLSRDKGVRRYYTPLMIAALSLSAWRARGRRSVCGVLAALAVVIHVLAMAVHQPPAAELALLDDAHALCLASGEAPQAPDHSAPVHPQTPPCQICQSLHGAVPPPQPPLIAAHPWAVVAVVVPPAVAAPPPRAALTDLNPRGPPVLG
jgi:hypothetical protein